MKTASLMAGSVLAVVALLISLTVTVAVVVIFGVAFLLSSQYGERIEFRNGELYFTQNVVAEDAEKLALFLEDQFGELENMKTFQLDRQGGNVVVRMCAQASTWETDETDLSFMALEALLETQVFPEENVVFELCNTYLEPQKSIDEI